MVIKYKRFQVFRTGGPNALIGPFFFKLSLEKDEWGWNVRLKRKTPKGWVQMDDYLYICHNDTRIYGLASHYDTTAKALLTYSGLIEAIRKSREKYPHLYIIK